MTSKRNTFEQLNNKGANQTAQIHRLVCEFVGSMQLSQVTSRVERTIQILHLVFCEALLFTNNSLHSG